jgi:hypothetical protein
LEDSAMSNARLEAKVEFAIIAGTER